MDLISVIVPIYKVEEYLDKCVSSIVGQTYSELEIILVDDGSPDGCPAMCDEWAKRDGRIRVIHKENGGLSDARNAGMQAATGEYIGFVDGDDYIAPEMYETLYGLTERDGSDIAACGVMMVWDDGSAKPLTPPGSHILSKNEAMASVIKEDILKQPVWYKIYKKKLICDIEFPKGKYHEDVFWTYRAVGCAERVSVTDTVGYYYRQRPMSIMSEGYSLKRLHGIEGKMERYDHIKATFPELLDITALDLWFSCLYQGQLALKSGDPDTVKKAMSFLNGTVRSVPVGAKGISTKDKIWLSLAKVDLKFACRIRNLFGIGC